MSIYESTTCNFCLPEHLSQTILWILVIFCFSLKLYISDSRSRVNSSSAELNDLNFCYRDSQLQVGENSYIPHFMLKSSSKIDDLLQ